MSRALLTTPTQLEGEEGQKLYDLALAMNHTEEGDDEAYAKAWFDFIADWNDELPEIPLYSNDYHDFFTSKLHDLKKMDTTGMQQTQFCMQTWSN